MNDKMREEFEVFWQEKILDAGWSLSKTGSYFVWKRAWQASRASLVVELPGDFTETDSETGSEYKIYYANEVKESITATGVKYK